MGIAVVENPGRDKFIDDIRLKIKSGFTIEYENRGTDGVVCITNNCKELKLGVSSRLIASKIKDMQIIDKNSKMNLTKANSSKISFDKSDANISSTNRSNIKFNHKASMNKKLIDNSDFETMNPYQSIKSLSIYAQDLNNSITGNPKEFYQSSTKKTNLTSKNLQNLFSSENFVLDGQKLCLFSQTQFIREINNITSLIKDYEIQKSMYESRSSFL